MAGKVSASSGLGMPGTHRPFATGVFRLTVARRSGVGVGVEKIDDREGGLQSLRVVAALLAIDGCIDPFRSGENMDCTELALDVLRDDEGPDGICLSLLGSVCMLDSLECGVAVDGTAIDDSED